MRTWIAPLILLSACSNGGPVAPVTVTHGDSGPLLQAVRVADTVLRRGAELVVWSVVHNRGPAFDSVVVQNQCLRFRGLEVSLAQPFDCEAVSTVVAPGDSIATADRRTVLATPGSYTLEIRQLVEPEVWVPVRVRVE